MFIGTSDIDQWKAGRTCFEPLVAENPYQEEKASIPEDALCTDSFSHVQPPKWRTVAFHSKTETIWMEDREEKSSQWAELQAVWLIITQEPSPIAVCTDSWTVYWGLTLWLPTCYYTNWMVGYRSLW